MIENTNKVVLYVDNQQLDLFQGSDLSISLVDNLYNPEKIDSTQSTYSFTFSCPATGNNCRIFQYADNLSQLNKFNKQFSCEIYANEFKIFSGSLLLQSYNSQEKSFECNVVQIKRYSLSDMFGDSLLSNIDWKIPYDGAVTINQLNADLDSKVYFPLVSYGVFQKLPSTRSNVNFYSDRLILDDTTQFYHETFSPSLNLMETVKKCFEYKGYNVSGNVFTDKRISNIYMSTNLSNDQNPVYNLGNSKMGSLNLSDTYTLPDEGNLVEYSYPYLTGFKKYNYIDDNTPYTPHYTVECGKYNILPFTNVSQTDYMINGTDKSSIVIPADGWYQIDLSFSMTMADATTWIRYWYFTSKGNTTSRILEYGTSGVRKPAMHLPIELQLVKNLKDSQIELIKGNTNIYFNTESDGDLYPSGFKTYKSCYPHEPKDTNDIRFIPTEEVSYSANNGNYYNQILDVVSGAVTDKRYYNRDGEIMAYDPVVNKDFICGFSTMNANPTMSVIKNGRGWSTGNTDNIQSLYTLSGYNGACTVVNENVSPGSPSYYTYYDNIPSTINNNVYPNSPSNSVTLGNNSASGTLHCAVYLKRNDILNLVAIRCNATNAGIHISTQYGPKNVEQYPETTFNYSLGIRALSTKTYDQMVRDDTGYNMDTEFSENLDLTQFLNKETKMSDFVDDVVKSFNLSYEVNGKNVIINTNRQITDNRVVNLDDRADYFESQKINFPQSIAVKYAIDTDEWGAWTTVPKDQQNNPRWEEYIDRGYDIVDLDKYAGESDLTVSLKNSYCWYDTFQLTQNNQDSLLTIPVISKYQYMAEGADYEEAMKKDGKSLKIRWWFRQPVSTNQLTLTNGQVVYADLPIGKMGNLSLNYKDKSDSLFRKYFNFNPNIASNYVEIECYLTPEDYLAFKGGAMAKFDDDIYYVSEIQGYDLAGTDQATIKLVKKV